MPDNKRTVTTYLILERKRMYGRRARVVRHSANQPTLERGQCAVKLLIEVDELAFDPVIDVPALTFSIGDTLRAQITKEKA